MPKLTIDIEGQLAGFQDSLNRLEGQAAGIGRRIEGAFRGVTGIVSGLGVAIAGVGFGRLVTNSIASADALQQLSDRTGVTVERLSALQYAAKLSDVSTDGLELGLRNLSKTMATGSEAFDALGVRVREASGVLRANDEVLLDVAERFASLPNGATKAALALKLFGKAGTELVPLLNEGREGIQRFTSEAEQLGVIVSSETAKAAAEFSDNMDKVRTAATGAANSLTTAFLPSLTQISERMVDAAKNGGVLESVLRGLGEAGKIALFGVDPTELEKQRRFVADVRKEIADLEDRVKYADKAGIIGRLSIGDPDELRRRLAGARITLKSAEDSLARMAAPPAAVAKPRDLVIEDDSAADKRRRAAEQALRERIAQVQEMGRIDRQAADDRAAVFSVYGQLELDAQKKRDDERIKLATEAQQALDRILSQTATGRLQDVQRQQGVLREALTAGKVSTEQFSEALALLDEQASDVLFGAGDKLKALADTGSEDIRRLEAAFEGFGRRASDTFAEFVVSGKASFSDLVQSIIKDLISLVAYKAVIGPVFGALGGFFGGAGGKGIFAGSANGNVFGPGGLVPFANGGLVTQPTVFPFANGVGLMGEAGPEAIMPLRRGPGGRLGVESSGGGGISIVNYQTFNGGADPTTLAAWGQAVKADTLNTIAMQKRRGMA